LTISYQEFHAAMIDARATAALTEKIAAKLTLSPREHNRIQKKVLDKVTPPMITIGCNQTAVTDSRGKGIPSMSERTKKFLQEIMAKRPQSVANEVGCTREQLIEKLNAKVAEGKKKRLELSEQHLFRQNVASVAAKMTLNNPEYTTLSAAKDKRKLMKDLNFY
jgi:hypothetical protein